MAKRVYRFISSMKTGLVILVLIGLVSALGTGFMPASFYQTYLFKILLWLLFINITLCTINQVKTYCKKSKGKDGLGLRRFAILLLHSGVVFILVGGAFNSYYGQNAMLRIIEGQTVDVSHTIKTDKPFSLKLDKFRIAFNSDGSPAQYYSYISMREGNKETGKYCVSVNQPLKYRGIKAYQESFGNLIKTEGEYGQGAKKQALLAEGDFFLLPGSQRKVKVYKYIPNFDEKYGMETKTLRPDNPQIIYSVYEKKKLLGVGVGSFGERIEIDKNVYIRFNGVQPYTVLKAKSDPGLPLSAAGGLMLMTGVCLAVFAPRR